jgi:hypothetical protein
MPYGYAVWLYRMAMPYGYAVWLCRMAMYCIIESFTCGTKSLMRGLMFESIRLLFWSLKYTNTDDYTKMAFHSHVKFDYR